MRSQGDGKTEKVSSEGDRGRRGPHDAAVCQPVRVWTKGWRGPHHGSGTYLSILIISHSNRATIIRIQELTSNNVEGVLLLRNLWPSIARTIISDTSRLTWCPTLGCSVLAMVLLMMSTGIPGSKDVSMVRSVLPYLLFIEISDRRIAGRRGQRFRTSSINW
jgi:hypothetical protein